MTHDPFPREPLTPEEQALARRLAQLGPQAEPSPALDARVLADLRAAEAQDQATQRVRPSLRWPVAFGLAASLLLAVGIAWQLRPLPGPVAETPQAAPASNSVSFIEPPPGARTKESAPVPAQQAAATPPSPSVRLAPPKPEAHPAPAAVAAPPAPEPAVTLDSMEPPAPTAAALPPPPPVSPAAQEEAPPAAARKAATEPQEDNQAFDAAAAADQAAGDEPAAEVPPATADSPEVRDAWLQRIRELAASGQTDAARASLREFIRRHPDAPLPDDLRALSR